MRQNWFIGVTVLAIFCSIAVFLMAAAPAAPQAPTWEYKVVRLSKDTGSENFDRHPNLNELGTDRWELVAVTNTQEPSAFGQFFFKRLK